MIAAPGRGGYTEVVRISYEEVVSAYERDLQTQLRGFRPAHAFLETWVHDADPARSLLNMVEAAELGGLERLEIDIGPETAKVLDAGSLREATGKLGQVTLEPAGPGLRLRVVYA